MLRYIILAFFVGGVKFSTGRPQNEVAEARHEITNDRIKNDDVGVNGFDNNREIIKNFRNPVLEYLLSNKNSVRTDYPQRKGIIREIKHSQTLLIPNGNNLLPGSLLNPSGEIQTETNLRNPENSPIENFLSYVKNNPKKTGIAETESPDLTSQVTNLNDAQKDDLIKVEIYPAFAILINTFNKNGILKNSVAHFQPDFDSIKQDEKKVENKTLNLEKNTNQVEKLNYAHRIDNLSGNSESKWSIQNEEKSQIQSDSQIRQIDQNQQQFLRQGGITWPFANYFPVVINDPFLTAYNAVTSSMYNAFSSVIEYGPEADICRKEDHAHEQRTADDEEMEEYKVNAEVKLVDPEPEKEEEDKSNIFDEIKLEGAMLKKEDRNKTKEGDKRSRRDATSILMKMKGGGMIDINVDEPDKESPNLKTPKVSDLVLRKGGVAIAGPGGAATAYTGGTAIVGPYGTVYKSPEGTAIIGPHSKIIDITDDTSFSDILEMHQQGKKNKTLKPRLRNLQTEPSTPRQSFKTYKNQFSYKTNLPLNIQSRNVPKTARRHHQNVVRLKESELIGKIQQIRNTEFKKITENITEDERMMKKNETSLIFRPKSKAEAGKNGVALSTPISHAILYPGEKANIQFDPESVASAGPGGFAHAHSDLYVSYLQGNRSDLSFTLTR